jgi:hypothetical protein
MIRGVKLVIVDVGNHYVSFRFEGTQRFLALKTTVEIPLRNIDEVSTAPAAVPWIAGKIGSHLPPFFCAGKFWTITGKRFYYMRDGSQCVTLKLKNHEYAAVIIEVSDKQTTAANIRKMLKNS